VLAETIKIITPDNQIGAVLLIIFVIVLGLMGLLKLYQKYSK